MNTVLPDHIVWNWKSQAIRVGVSASVKDPRFFCYLP